MHEIVNIPVSDLLLDPANPRLKEEQPSQPATALALAELEGGNLVRLAGDVVENGLDPLNYTAVVATGDRRKRYRVLEGNRRTLAVKALESPALVSPALSAGDSKKLAELARKYAANPVSTMPCVLFDTEDEAQHWIYLRHTGSNSGVGLASWDSTEIDRYRARHTGGKTSRAGQVIEFVEKHGDLSPTTKASNQKIFTTLNRLLGSPEVREKLGIDVVEGEVISLYEKDEIVKSLSRVVDDLQSGRKKVPDLYHVQQRIDYVNSLPKSVLPRKSKILMEPLLLTDVTAEKKTPRAVARKKTSAKKKPARTTVIPSSCDLEITPPRINQVYTELSRLNAEDFPNACSVLFRVFIELSLDHHIEQANLMTEHDLRNKPLAKKLHIVADHLLKQKRIASKLQVAIGRIADGNTSVLAPGIPTFHMYVHNEYVFPRPTELYTSWDEISPFMEALWPTKP